MLRTAAGLLKARFRGLRSQAEPTSEGDDNDQHRKGGPDNLAALEPAPLVVIAFVGQNCIVIVRVAIEPPPRKKFHSVSSHAPVQSAFEEQPRQMTNRKRPASCRLTTTDESFR
jgi:hypothetical protein